MLKTFLVPSIQHAQWPLQDSLETAPLIYGGMDPVKKLTGAGGAEGKFCQRGARNLNPSVERGHVLKHLPPFPACACFFACHIKTIFVCTLILIEKNHNEINMYIPN